MVKELKANVDIILRFSQLYSNPSALCGLDDGILVDSAIVLICPCFLFGSRRHPIRLSNIVLKSVFSKVELRFDVNNFIYHLQVIDLYESAVGLMLLRDCKHLPV